jgi:hypothetical protein
MNKLLPLALLAATWNLILLPCHADPIGPKPGELVTMDGFQLSITADSQEFVSGSAIMLSTLAKNVTDKKLFIVASSNQADYRIEVTTEKGEKIPATRYGQRVEQNKGTYFSRGAVEVLPGNSYDQEILVNQRYDMTEPGVYLVKVKRSVPLGDGKTSTDVTSNTLRLTIVYAPLKSSPPW